MVSNSAGLITVDTGPKPLHPVLWLVRLGQLDDHSRESLQSAVATWDQGNRAATVEWLRELMSHIRSQVTTTDNREAALTALGDMVERLEVEALKVELFWICGVPADAHVRGTAAKSSTRIRDGQLPFNALRVRGGRHDGAGRLF
ncbi:hypothetical protein VT03_27925 [Planctomyces sp. SH-PL14]|nr:hypothetical protein VT03_27925 [Planctomyces sp. SH-PL14]